MMKKKVLSLVLLFSVTAGSAFFLPIPLWAVYPEKPVTFLCGYPPGGAQDMIARTMTETVKKYFPKPMVVVNRPGAAGTIMAAEVYHAKPDGYSIGVSSATMVTLQPRMTKLPYGSPADFTAIIRLASNPCLIAVKSAALWKTIQEFIDYARANPGKIRVGNSGIGTQCHLDAEMLRLMAKLDLVAVPFAGSGESVPAVLGGHVEATCTHPSGVLGHVQAGKVRVLAVFEEKRNPLFPEAPTFKEIGYDITTAVYYQFIGPKGLPPQIVSTLHDAFKKGMEDPAFVKPMATQGWQIDYEGPQDLAKRLLKDYEMNTKLVDLLNLKGKGH